MHFNDVSQVPNAALRVRNTVCSASRRLSGGRLLLPQLFFPSILEAHHALFESPDLALTCSPVLVFGHALLDSIVQVSTASAGNHLLNRVILVIFPAAVMGWSHPVWIHLADSGSLFNAAVNVETLKRAGFCYYPVFLTICRLLARLSIEGLVLSWSS